MKDIQFRKCMPRRLAFFSESRRIQPPRRLRWEARAQHGHEVKVVGFGLAVLDHLLEVPSWPAPDQKLCIPTVKVEGGGNCGNALTTLSRLGLRPTIVTKLGKDYIGDQIKRELRDDGVDTSLIFRSSNQASSSSYIIVDHEGQTRTCIYTEAPSFDPGELEHKLDSILDDAKLVFFDGWLTNTAVQLAQAAEKAGIPMLVEAEIPRPYLDELLSYATYISTSSTFPQAWTNKPDLEDALLEMLSRYPRAKWIFTTRGSKGSILLEKVDLQNEHTGEASSKCSNPSVQIQRILEDLRHTAEFDIIEETRDHQPQDSPTIRPGHVLECTSAFQLDPENLDTYGSEDSNSTGVRIYAASAAILDQACIRDTTGAGDASVGTLLYSLANNMDIHKMMKLAAIVSAYKCTKLGARNGLPKKDDLNHLIL